MSIPSVVVWVLLIHVLADFYLQNNEVAAKKDTSLAHMLQHCGIYTACMAILLAIGVPFSRELVWLWLFLSFSHLLIDMVKKHIPNKRFILDQLLHLLCIGAGWYFGGKTLTLKAFFMSTSLLYPDKPILYMLLGVLLILRPVGLLIASGDIWDFSKSANPPNESQKGAGRMIGYLERIVVFFLLLNNQYSAIAFVIAAKSVARFPEIKNESDKSLAEYYLIGTFLSMVSVFAVALLLGLLRPNV